MSSTFLPVSNGVPQGSVLGRLLFSLYVKDFPYVLKYCKIYLYANHVQIYHSCIVQNVDVCEINEDLKSVSQWTRGIMTHMRNNHIDSSNQFTFIYKCVCVNENPFFKSLPT